MAAPVNVDNLWWDDNWVNPQMGATNGGWQWVTANPAPFSGVPFEPPPRAFQTPNNVNGTQYYYFYNQTNPTPNPNGDVIRPVVGDHLYTYVFIDPAQPLNELKLVWRNAQTGGWEGGYWGPTDPIGNWGFTQFSNTVPTPGQWVRLDIPFT